MVIDYRKVSSLTYLHPLGVGRRFCSSCEQTPEFRYQISTNRFASGVLGKAVCVRRSLMGSGSVDK